MNRLSRGALQSSSTKIFLTTTISIDVQRKGAAHPLNRAKRLKVPFRLIFYESNFVFWPAYLALSTSLVSSFPYSVADFSKLSTRERGNTHFLVSLSLLQSATCSQLGRKKWSQRRSWSSDLDTEEEKEPNVPDMMFKTLLIPLRAMYSYVFYYALKYSLVFVKALLILFLPTRSNWAGFFSISAFYLGFPIVSHRP